MTQLASPQIDRDVSRYSVGGARVPSVTEVLSIAGLVNFDGVPANLLASAAERGRAAHRITQLYDQGEDPKQAPNYGALEPYLAAYLKFRADVQFEPLFIEQLVVSQTYRFAGTFDRLGTARAGELWLIDLKTSASISSWVGLQLAGYEIGLREELGQQDPIKRFALRLLLDGSYRLVPFADRSDHHDFLACTRIAHWRLRKGGVRL